MTPVEPPEPFAMYLKMSDEPIARTVEVCDLFIVDVDAANHPVGIEMLRLEDANALLEGIAALGKGVCSGTGQS